jgi:toluene monooxygenase system protein A
MIRTARRPRRTAIDVLAHLASSRCHGILMDHWFLLGEVRPLVQGICTSSSSPVRAPAADVGLQRPYGQHFDDIETHHHCQQAGIWSAQHGKPDRRLRQVGREWLEQKYPGWNDSYGRYWDVIIGNLLAGHEEKTHPNCIPVICNMCQIPISNKGGAVWKARIYQREHEGRRYNFCTPVCR